MQRRQVCGIDDANKSQTDARNNENGANIVEAWKCFFPLDTLGMLWWEIVEGQSDQRDDLCDEAAVENVLPTDRRVKVLADVLDISRILQIGLSVACSDTRRRLRIVLEVAFAKVGDKQGRRGGRVLIKKTHQLFPSSMAYRPTTGPMRTMS
jgi:hypothetical protein